MAKKNGAKYVCLQRAICNFSVEVGATSDKEKFNAALDRLWKTIDELQIFTEK